LKTYLKDITAIKQAAENMTKIYSFIELRRCLFWEMFGYVSTNAQKKNISSGQ